MEKSAEKNRNTAIAGRLAYLRAEKFETVGFKSNEPVPTISQARKMATENRVRMGKLPKSRSVRG